MQKLGRTYGFLLSVVLNILDGTIEKLRTSCNLLSSFLFVAISVCLISAEVLHEFSHISVFGLGSRGPSNDGLIPGQY